MGQKEFKNKLFESIKNDNYQKVKTILLNHRKLLNDFINPNKDYTPIMCCAYYNSVDALNVLIDLLANHKLKEPTCGNSILHIACERNNLKIIKEIIGKGLVDIAELNAYEMNCLDSALVNRAYSTCHYLINIQKMQFKPIEDYKKYIALLKLLDFKIELFIDCIKRNTPFEDTPSFLYKSDDLSSKYFLQFIPDKITCYLEKFYLEEEEKNSVNIEGLYPKSSQLKIDSNMIEEDLDNCGETGSKSIKTKTVLKAHLLENYQRDNNSLEMRKNENSSGESTVKSEENLNIMPNN